MDGVELRQRVAAGEDSHTDFKERFGTHRELAKDLVCFANADGGMLLFGIRDDGEIIGVDEPERLAIRIDEVAHEHCVPPITALIETVDVGAAKVVAVRVPKGGARPYATKRGQYYIRSGVRCRQPSREEILRLFQSASALFYDETPLVTTSWGDVDVDAVEAHTDEIGLDKSEYHDPRQLLRNWRLFDGTHLTIAGTVLFARRPQLHLPYAKVIAARFPGTDTSSDTLDRADISGQLFDVIYRCEGFLRTHLPYEHRIRGFDPERQAELPETALREAVVNALGHRDYTVRGPVRLFVLDDRVEIHTPGTTPNTIDEAAMRAGAHVVRNPHIYARLLEAGLVTSAGTGVRRMSRLVREAVKKDISIAITDAEVLVTLPRLAH